MATILLAEDDTEVMRAVVRLLSSCGYHIIEAENGNEALELLREYKDIIDLVVSDHDMNPVNGLEVLKEVRKHKTKEELPFILHTGSLNQSVHDQCVELGGVSCSKTSGKLVGIVEELLKQ